MDLLASNECAREGTASKYGSTHGSHKLRVMYCDWMYLRTAEAIRSNICIDDRKVADRSNGDGQSLLTKERCERNKSKEGVHRRTASLSEGVGGLLNSLKPRMSLYSQCQYLKHGGLERDLCASVLGYVIAMTRATRLCRRCPGVTHGLNW